MGFVKFHEDIIDILYEGKSFNGENANFTPTRINYVCYYCSESFTNIDDRITHVRKKHNVPGPLLLINGKIITGQSYLDVVFSAKIIMCGYRNLEISIDGESIKYKDAEIDLISYFNINEKNIYSIKIGNRRYTIYKYKRIDIENPAINDIIKNWEIKLSKAEDLFPLDRNYLQFINEAELLYLNGFFEYFIASRQRINPEDRRNRYENAYAILSSFNKLPPKARLLLKVIAFRLNWIEKLESLAKASKGVFDIVIDFYQDIKSDNNKFQELKDSEQQIFVEIDIQECFNAIKAYQNNNLVEVDVYLTNWNDDKLGEIEDSNKKDRILLLKARKMRMSRNIAAAKKYYSQIKSPFIRKEADIFIQNN